MASPQQNLNSFRTRQQLNVAGQRYHYHSLAALSGAGFDKIARLPYSIRILLENQLRHEDGVTVKKADIAAVAQWDARATPDKEIFFMPARVLLQDFTGVPAVADLAAMRAALKNLGGGAGRGGPGGPAGRGGGRAGRGGRY